MIKSELNIRLSYTRWSTGQNFGYYYETWKLLELWICHGNLKIKGNLKSGAILRISKLCSKYRYHNWWLSSQVNLNFDYCKIISVQRHLMHISASLSWRIYDYLYDLRFLRLLKFHPTKRNRDFFRLGSEDFFMDLNVEGIAHLAHKFHTCFSNSLSNDDFTPLL